MRYKKTVASIAIILVLLIMFFMPLLLFEKPDTILLSFDLEDNISEDNVRDLLGLLAAHNVHATFFVTGEVTENHPELIQEIEKTGHEIGCQSYEKVNLKKLNFSEQTHQIEECIFAVDDVIGELPTGFRAPFRKENPLTAEILKASAMHYDASGIENVPLYFPNPMVYPLDTSSYFIFPMSDNILMNYYGFSENMFFRLLVNYPGDVGVFSFEPELIMQSKENFNELLKYWDRRDVQFVTHEERYQKVIEEAISNDG